MNISRKISKTVRGAGRRIAKTLMPSPVDAYHERSMLYIPQRGSSEPNSFLLDLAMQTIRRANEISLAELTERLHTGSTDAPNLWPGEHYRLLTAITEVFRPTSVVEIGTYHGLSTLAINKGLKFGARVVTFDLTSWSQFQHTCFRPSDFEDGTISQQIGDLGDPDVFEQHKTLLSESEMIFCDGPKDGFFERNFLRNLSKLRSTKLRLLVFDDIRLWNMLATWREIERPKLDVTSFGHWTGTGLVDWMAEPTQILQA